MRKFCADPNCHTAIPETEIVCSLHKSLIELDEIQGEILERECIHEWKDRESQFSNEFVDDVYCKKCLISGERNKKTAKVFYPVS